MTHSQFRHVAFAAVVVLVVTPGGVGGYPAIDGGTTTRAVDGLVVEGQYLSQSGTDQQRNRSSAAAEPVMQPVHGDRLLAAGAASPASSLELIERALRSSAAAVNGPGVVLVAGYARRSGDVLDHDARSELFALVECVPGVHVAAASDRTDVPASTLRYHCRVLESEGLIDSEVIRGRRRLFPADTPGPDRHLAAALADDRVAAVVDAVAEHEPVTVSDLAVRLDRSPSTISHHVSELSNGDLVERERDGRSVLVRLTPCARERYADLTGRIADD